MLLPPQCKNCAVLLYLYDYGLMCWFVINIQYQLLSLSLVSQLLMFCRNEMIMRPF